MADVFSNIGLGLSVAASLQNLVYCMLGVLLGTLVGVLPGVGPVTTVAMLLPISFTLEPTSALILMAGIYYGAQYGGSTTAILINIPGEASSVITSLDGHQMARQGRAGPALGIAALGSFFAGCVATFIIAFGAPPLAKLALQFGPAEYFSLMLCGLVAAVVLARGSIIKAIAMVVLGLLFGLAGSDVNSGIRRFTFDMQGLADGIEFVALSMAIYGIAEVAINLERRQEEAKKVSAVGKLMPSGAELRACTPSILRGTFLGSILGVLPGGGALLAAFAAYTLEKKVAKPPRKFGEGDIRGVAAPESANNAGAQTSFIPMLTLGIPGDAVTALMIAGFMIHGLQPGPLLFREHSGIVADIYASYLVSTIAVLLFQLATLRIFPRILLVPHHYLLPVMLTLTVIGAYAADNQTFDVWVMFGFGALALVLERYGFSLAAFVLGFLLGPILELNLRRALTYEDGDLTPFLTRPISATMLALTAVALGFILFRQRRGGLRYADD